MKGPVVLGFRVLHITCALCWALLSEERGLYVSHSYESSGGEWGQVERPQQLKIHKGVASW
jgi:hypothetical protein